MEKEKDAVWVEAIQRGQRRVVHVRVRRLRVKDAEAPGGPVASVTPVKVLRAVRPQGPGRTGVMPRFKAVGRAIASGAGTVLDLAGSAQPSLRERVHAIRHSSPAFALLRDRAVLAGDLKRASRKVLDEEADRHGL